MDALFLNVIDATVSGSVVILAVLLLRLVLGKAPKKYICLLWILAVLRLLCPVEIESNLSLQPQSLTAPQEAWVQRQDYGRSVIEEVELVAPVQENSSQALTAAPALVPDGAEEQIVEATVERYVNWTVVVPYVWFSGVCILGFYSLISYLRLKRRVREAVRTADGFWECGGLETAFILGYLQPRIYIPMGLPDRDRTFVLSHEQTHLRRGDHWVKLLAFITLAVHWFNPLVWAAYILLCRDMEMACDEAVVKGMALAERKAYSTALLACSANHRSLAACPVAFGEVSVKGRIIKVLNYRKPAFWITILAVIAIVVVAVCFMTNPAANLEEKAVESLYAELERIQNSEDLYLSISTTIDGEYGYYLGHEQEFRKNGDNWYRIFNMETIDGTYTEEYMQIGEHQYVRRDSDQIPDLESLDWFEISEENHLDQFFLLTRDWTQCEVLEVREEENEDGGLITVLIQGNLEETSKQSYYEHTHAFHLDEDYRLVGVVEYSFVDRYINERGKHGRYDMESWSAVRICEVDPDENERIIDEAMQEVLSIVGAN